jgi:hypothetical protein
MNKKTIKNEKYLATGIIVLLLTVIIPIVGANNIQNEKNDIKTLNLADPLPVVVGTAGMNNWFISCIRFSFYYDPAGVNQISYYLNQQWQTYSSPVEVCTEGYTTINWKWTDKSGIEHSGLSFSFKIDQSPPTIKISKKTGSDDKVTFTATCEDKISLVDHVEFYLDNEIQATINEKPYQWTWTGTDKHDVYAIGYNKAGLHKQSDTISTPRVLILNYNLQILNKLFNNILERLGLLIK